nr:putative ribonuclease H-like domain-containing protein [Tanacetum cinerariifolium]
TDSTTESVSAAASVSAVCAKLPASTFPNIDVDDLEETDLRWQMPMLTMRARSQSTSPQLDNEDLKQIDVDDLEEIDLRCQPSGEYLAVPPPIIGNFMPPKPDLVFHTAPIVVETTHSAFTIQHSLAKHAQDISYATRPMAPINEDWVSDSEDESDPNDPQSAPSFVQTFEHAKISRRSILPVEASILETTPNSTSSKTKGSRPKNRKTCFVCRGVDHLIKDCNFHAKTKIQPTPRNSVHRGYHKQYASSTKKYPKKHIVPAAVITKSKPVSVTAARLVSAAIPKIMATKPRHSRSLHTKTNLSIRRHKTRSIFSKTGNSFPKVTAAHAKIVSAAKGKKGKWGNPQHALKDKEVIDSNSKGGKITGKRKIKTGKLDFEDVYFVKELKFNLFSVSQMCDKKNKVLFTDSEYLVLSPDFKLPNENQVLLKVPRENNMYNVNLKDIVPSGDLTCLFAKEIVNESNLWHRRMGHVNFKTINKLVKGNLVRGLPIKVFENQNTCVACMKGKQHRASCKTKPVSFVTQPLFRLHMNLFGPTFVKSLNSLLPIPFWAEAVNTACYVPNRVLVTKPQNKTPYELLHGRPPIGIMRPFGCPVTILNILDSLGKFEGKVDEGFLVGYSVNSKAFRVFNSRTRIVQETLHVNFLENEANIAGNQSNPSAGFQEEFDAGKIGKEVIQQYMLFPVWSTGSTNPHNKEGDATFDGKTGEEARQQYMLFLVWCTGSINLHTKEGDATFDGKEHDAEKPESTVNLSLRNSALLGEQDDMTKKKDKGKSHVDYFTRNRDFN